MPWNDEQTHEHVARVEALLSALDTLPHEAARTRATETVEALVDLYGEGLARIMDHLAGSVAGEVTAALADDELVGHLLLVHGLHPVATEQRVRLAVDEANQRLRPQDGRAELVGLDQGVARIRVPGGGHGCGSGAAALTAAVQDAVARLAPEVEGVETVQDTAAAARTLIPVDSLLRGLRTADHTPQQTGTG